MWLLQLCDSCDSQNSYRKKKHFILQTIITTLRKKNHLYRLRSLRLCDSCDSKICLTKKIFHLHWVCDCAIPATPKNVRQKNISFYIDYWACDLCDCVIPATPKNVRQKSILFRNIGLRSLRLCDSCDSKICMTKKYFIYIEFAIIATVRFLRLQKFLDKKNISFL